MPEAMPEKYWVFIYDIDGALLCIRYERRDRVWVRVSRLPFGLDGNQADAPDLSLRRVAGFAR